jgi:hypothetical protein
MRHLHGRRLSGGGRGAIAAGAIAAVAVATVSAAWPVSSSAAPARPLRAATSTKEPARPPGVPVTFQRAQLSVPGGWFVEGAQQFVCPGKSGGMIFAGIKPRIPKGAGCRLTASFAWIVPAGRVPAGISHRKPTAVINGLPVYRVAGAGKSVVYLVPRLGVRVGAHGRLAKSILATLARSPLDVVLARGPVSPVPAHWVRREFGGVKFATPRDWHLDRETQWEACGTGISPRGLLLVNAKKKSFPLPCPFPVPIARGIQAVPGLVVITGKFAAQAFSEHYPSCIRRHGTKICLSAETGVGGLFGGVLIFTVSRPHHHAKTFLELGLSETGGRARAIFDSISVG